MSPTDLKLCETCSATILQEKREFIEFPSLLNSFSMAEFLPQIDTFIFDADGVLCLGDVVLPGAPQFLEFVLHKEKRVIVLTNNPTKSRVLVAKKLKGLGFSGITKDNVVNPPAVAAALLHSQGFANGDKQVYVIGSRGLVEELDNAGIQNFGNGPEKEVEEDFLLNEAITYDSNFAYPNIDVGAVVVGFDKHFNYVKMTRAANFLQNRSCLFIGTNEDETCPGSQSNMVFPDTGPILAAVKVAAGREPMVMGKPHKYAFQFICQRWNIQPSRTVMVGDRTNTDIRFGRRNGLKTLLVLSGCHSLEDVRCHQLSERREMVPDYYACSLGDLL